MAVVVSGSWGWCFRFVAPILAREAVTATVEVTHIREDKPIVTLSTQCFKEDGTLAIDGEAVVKVPVEMVGRG